MIKSKISGLMIFNYSKAFIKKHIQILLGILILSSIFFLSYPTRYIAIDEHDYLYNSKNIVNNELKMSCDGSSSQFKVTDYCVYKYNIGTSIILLPAVLINTDLAFLTTFVFFIIAIIYFYKTILISKLPKQFILLFALFPPFLYYSRTLYSEIYSLTFITISLYHLIKIISKPDNKDSIFLGLALGAVSLIRYSNILIGVIIGGYLIFNYSRSSYKKILFFILGALPAIIFFLWFNNYLYGSPIRSGYYFSGEESAFDFINLFSQGFKYLLALLLMYPGLLLGIKFLNKPLEIISLLVASIFWLIYSLFTNNNGVFEGRVVDLIFGLRFFIPIMPFLLLGYIKMLDKKITKLKYFKYLYFALILLLTGIYITLTTMHQVFLQNY